MPALSGNNLMRFKVVSGGYSSQQDDEDEPHIDHESVPAPCSGHKIVLTEDYIYLIGGTLICSKLQLKIFLVWRFNLLLETWTKLRTPVNFPSHLASFGVCNFFGFSEKLLMFGGTGYPFGSTICNKVHVINIPLDETKTISVNTLEVKGELVENRYGHAFKTVTNHADGSEAYYCIGGTDGQVYDLDVYVIRWKKDGFYWEKEATTPLDIQGLYKFDVAEYDGKFYFFGGGTVDAVKGLDELYVYDTNTKTYSTVLTSPDPQHGYPAARKCHSATEFEGSVIITGGSTVGFPGGEPHIFDDVWSFNMSKKEWKKLDACLNSGLFFHDAAVTEEGCLYVFGGVKDGRGARRTNVCQKMWLKPPSLKTLAGECIVQNYNNQVFLRMMDPTCSSILRYMLPLLPKYRYNRAVGHPQ
ncbi:unnamed protein product [Auanema sp. JU1783]|nr:unnamed protein product [Auanema sp. JU1783]